ncbi:MAG: AfsR/SARP family transcriptional regulator, partial [Catenulispora sp.]|nr:AfsR/SARP family transcriptional regulator [Catenulispora sp.]
AERLTVRGEFERAGELYDQAVAVVAEAGDMEDVIRIRARQALLFWMAGEQDTALATIAAAEQNARRVTWPSSLVELALTRAELARWNGDGPEARRQLGIATALLGDQAEEPTYRALLHTMLGYLAEDVDKARAHRAAAFRAAPEAGPEPLIANVLVGVADLALRMEDPEQAVRLLAAAATLRGLPDHRHPDVARVEREARDRLGDARYAEAVREGTEADWTKLAEVTLA